MSDSSTTLSLLASNQAQKELVANALFKGASHAIGLGFDEISSSGTSWYYHEGYVRIDGVVTKIAKGFVTLVNGTGANLTNYIEVDRSGTVSINQTSFTAGKFPLYSVVVAPTTLAIVSYVDNRSYDLAPGFLAITLTNNADYTISGAQWLNKSFRFLGGGITANSNIILPLVKGWAYDVINASGYDLTLKSSTGTGVTITNGSSSRIVCNGTNWYGIAGGGGGSSLPVDDSVFLVTGSADNTKRLRFEVDGFTTSTDRVATWPDKDGTVAMLSDLPASLPVVDTTEIVKGSADATKKLRFEVDGFTTATTRVATWPNKDGTIAMLDDIPAGGGTAPLDFNQHASTSGLDWYWESGKVRFDNTIYTVSSNYITLTDDTVNYVELNSSGTVVKNTTGFTAGNIPLRQLTTASGSITVSTDKRAWLSNSGSASAPIQSIIIAASDETTALTTGTAKTTFRMPYAFTLTEVRASLTTADTGSSSTLVVDINHNGSSIFTTNLLSIDDGEKTSTTAATSPNITTSSLSDDSEITIDIDQVGTNADSTGLKVSLIGYKT